MNENHCAQAFEVLVVDDHPAHRAYSRCVFEALGCRVHTVDDGFAAIDAAAARRFDLILMDRVMPGCNGDTATRAIRARGPSKGALIICHTVDELRPRLAAMYDRIVRKPATTYDVLDLVPGKPKPRRFSIDLSVFRRASAPPGLLAA